MNLLLLLANGLTRLLSWLPLGLLHAAAWPLGRLLYWVPWKKHSVIATNLALCFPELEPAERRRLHRDYLVEQCRLVFEAGAVFHWSKERLHAHIETAGWEAVEEAANAERGVLLVSAHIGNWELLNLYLALHLPLATLYRAPENKALDAFITRPRERFGGRMVPGGSPALRQLLGQLKKHQAVAVAADIQPKRGDGAFVPLFGQSALTMTLVTGLARRTGCAVFFCSALRQPKGRGWRLHFQAAAESIGDPDPANALTPINQWLENAIRQAPAQYLWLYKRFSRQPDGHNPYKAHRY